MKKCKNCGALFTDDVSFCSECGESLGGKRVHVEKKKLGCGRVFLIFYKIHRRKAKIRLNGAMKK